MDKNENKKISADSPDFIASLATGLDVLLVFDKDHSSMTLSEVAERANMDRAKARRYLLTLHALGYVNKNKRQFSLTPKTLTFGARYFSSVHHYDLIQFYLEKVTEKTGESCSFAVLDGNAVVYIARSSTKNEHRLLSTTLSIGTRLPAAYSSMGRIIVANLPEKQMQDFIDNVKLQAHTPNSITDRQHLNDVIKEAKQQQYVIVDQELDTGLRSLAIPAFRSNNELIGAVNISGNAMRLTTDVMVNEYLPLLRECADNIKKYYV